MTNSSGFNSSSGENGGFLIPSAVMRYGDYLMFEFTWQL